MFDEGLTKGYLLGFSLKGFCFPSMLRTLWKGCSSGRYMA
jgi:hypothetical protein